jgi:hypothetical protein
LFKQIPEGGDDIAACHTPPFASNDKMMTTEPSSFSSTPRGGPSSNGLQSANPETYNVGPAVIPIWCTHLAHVPEQQESGILSHDAMFRCAVYGQTVPTQLAWQLQAMMMS